MDRILSYRQVKFVSDKRSSLFWRRINEGEKKFENGGSRFDGLTIDSDTVYTVTISTELDGKTITQGPIL
jgi:hypothetical protein